MALLVQFRDRFLVVQGELATFSSLALTLKHLDISEFELKLPAPDAKVAELDISQVDDGLAGGLLVWDDDVSTASPIFTGRFTGLVRDSGEEGDVLTLRGQEDSWWLARRVAYPVPGQPASSQTASAQDVRTGPAETVLKGYLDANAGPAALAARRITGLTVAASLGRGPTRTERHRFTPLLELTQTLCAAAGLGFAATQQGAAIVFEVTEPVDRSASVVLSRARENLGTFSYGADAAGATVAIVGGQGTGTARVFRERGSGTGDARAEVFVDRRDTSVNAELDQAGDDALAEAAAQLALSFTPLHTLTSRFGVDYRLGDRVSAVVDDVSVVDVVRQVTLTFADGYSHPPEVLVGTPTRADLRRLLRALPTLPGLARRLGYQERAT